MRPLLVEHVAIVCQSACHVLLRAVGLSKKHPYTVMVRGEPVWWRDVETNVAGKGGIYSTRVVMADSESEAESSAIKHVSDALSPLAGNPKDSPVLFAIETCTKVGGVAWRQFRGFTFWEQEE